MLTIDASITDPAANFNPYQNVAVVIVIVLAFIAVMGATWASWGIRQGARWKGTSTHYHH